MHQFQRFIIIAAVLFFDGISFYGQAQESSLDLKKEIEELKQGQQAIRKDLMEIKELLSKTAPPPSNPQVNIKGVDFDLVNNPVRGSDTAKLLLVEFTDYQ